MIMDTAQASMNNPLGIIGNRDLLCRLTRDAREGTLSHAYIIDGKVGSGRHTVARHLACACACHHRPGRVAVTEHAGQMGFFDDEAPVIPDVDIPIPCGVCEGCRKVRENICPDVITVGREGKATLGVEAVRRIKESIYMAPGEMEHKVYIIEDAETMTPQAQNALLLSLEEPPPYVLFLLLCNGAENLLETIRSRAPVLHTSPIPHEEIRAYLSAHQKSLPSEEMEALLICADGAIGQALALSDPKSLKSIIKQRSLVDTFIQGYTRRQSGLVPSVLGQFGTKRDEVLSLLSLITLAVRDLILLKKSETALLKYYTDREIALSLTEELTLKTLLSLYDALENAKDDLTRNGNIRLTLTHLWLSADGS
ncbi:MAG: hypothetical protein E7661_10155 [Ruminococcaceae bacterium]|nr:hypothetical protein [Oscillospiraceae bacterium]